MSTETVVSFSSWAEQNRALLIAVAVIVLLLLVIMYRGKSGFVSGVPAGEVLHHDKSMGNLFYHGNSPQWQQGAMDAGNWGSMHHYVPTYSAKFYDRGVQAWTDPNSMTGISGGSSRLRESAEGTPFAPPEGAKEGFTSADVQQAFGVPDPLADMKYIRAGDCGYTDVGAAAEVQALTSMGCYTTSPYGAGNLQRMIDNTENLQGNFSPAQLDYSVQTTGGF